MKRSAVVRSILAVAGAVGVAVFFTGTYRSWFLALAGVLALFLGITDFGRRCPLFLSARHLMARWRYRQSTEH